MNGLTKFDARHCHKSAQLLLARQEKLNQALKIIIEEDFGLPKRLFSQIFTVINSGKQAEPGMTGSPLYHMAMITKMETETAMLIEELHVNLPDITLKLSNIYSDFESDPKELIKEITPFTLSFKEKASIRYLETNEKNNLFTKLTKENKKVETLLNNKNPKSYEAFKKIFPCEVK